jgi:outer membrane receptor protein involved in Fe transport
MEEELVFIGDEGSTEISGETRRLGFDAEMRFQLNPWIWADVDVNLADGKYLDEPGGADHIPLAPRLTSQGGLVFLHPGGFEGALRYRHVGDRPANEDQSIVAKGHTLIQLSIAYRSGGFLIFGQIENLTARDWNEAQFDTESRLQHEPGGISELHFTPGNPFNFQLGVAYEF